MNKIQVLFFFAITVLAMASCRHTSDLPVLPEVKFQTDVLPLLIGNCTQGGCHGNSDHRRFSLTSYDELMASGIVVTGDAHNSKLYKSITGKSDIMPRSPQKPLNDAEVSYIYVWIMQGAKNN